MSDATLKFFQRVPLFAGLGRADLEEILKIVTRVQLKPRQRLFAEGEEGADAYLVETGAISVSTWADGRAVPIARVGPGEVLGEVALVDARVRSASAEAVVGTLLFRIDGAKFAKLRAALRPAAAKITRQIARTLCGRLRDTNEQVGKLLATYAGLPDLAPQGTPAPFDKRASQTPTEAAVSRLAVFASLAESERRVLADHMHLCALDAGANLFAEGTVAMSCYFIVIGEVGVYKALPGGAEERLATLASGAVAGHLALIDNGRRSATCRVETERAVFLELSRDNFEMLFEAQSPFAYKVMFGVVKDLAARLRTATERLTVARGAQSDAARRSGARQAAADLERSHGAQFDITDQDLSRWDTSGVLKGR